MHVTRDFRLGAAFLGVELVLSGIYFLFPTGGTAQSVLYECFGGAAVGAILWGVHTFRPKPALPWFVFATGVSLFVVGDILLDAYPNWTSPSAADWFYLAAYPLFASTVVMLVVSTGSHRGLGAAADALIVTVAFAVLEWTFVMASALHTGGPLGQRVVLRVLYPAMDIVLLGAAIDYFVSPRWRTPAFGLLLLGLFTQLVGDTAVALALPANMAGSWTDWPFMASYIFWGAAALHPSMRELGTRVQRRETHVSRLRIAALGCALLTSATAAILVVAHMTGMLSSLDRVRKRLALQNEQLIHADRAKDEFIALVSHDLRTPLRRSSGMSSSPSTRRVRRRSTRSAGAISRSSREALTGCCGSSTIYSSPLACSRGASFSASTTPTSRRSRRRRSTRCTDGQNARVCPSSSRPTAHFASPATDVASCSCSTTSSGTP